MDGDDFPKLLSMPANSMKAIRIAYIVAFGMAALIAAGALTGPIVLLPSALIPLVAGIGILRKRVWSAYGFALYLLAQLLLAAFLLFRTKPPNLVAQILLLVILVPLFLFAGRALSASGAQRGVAWLWVALSALTTLPIIFVQAFVIPTGAMENTLLIGDRILVRRFPKPRVARGDLIVFAYPIDRSQTFTKRVIGVPGDRIKIAEKIVYVNGALLNEPYVVHKSPYPDSYRDNLPSEPNSSFANAAREMLKNNVVNGEVVVPQGEYFVLGDNRDNSLDSRYWGFVGSGDLIGKPLLIYDSEEVKTDSVPVGNAIYPRRRWSRFFKVL
jgi:signal peptidase I